MRKLLAVLALVLLSALAGPAFAEDDTRAVIARAVAAQGGEEKLARRVAVAMRIKGTLYATQDDGMPLTGDLVSDPGGRLKFTLRVQVMGAKLDLTQVLDNGKGWRSLNGELEELKEDTLREMKESAYIDRVTSLVPLLKEDGFTLTALGEGKVNGQAVQRVKVAAQGQPDVTLSFAKEGGLLVKYEHKGKDFGAAKEVLQETYFSDYHEPDLAAPDEQTLQAAKVAVDGAALVEFLKRRTPDAGSEAKIKELIKKLGDDAFEVREKASADLVALGTAAVPLLRQAAKDSNDLEVLRRAQQCLQQIGDKGGDALVLPAVRLVALRKPDGAAAVLLDFAARTGDEELAREARAALAALAERDGKADPVVAQALEDKDSGRRGAAAAVLGKDGGAYLKQPGRRLFPDGVFAPPK